MKDSTKNSNIPGLTKEEILEMRKLFKRFPEIKSVILFGSRAMGNHKSGSDVDLALKGAIDSNIVFQVHDFLEEETLIPYFFDVVDYSALENPNLKKHIDTEGHQIYLQK